MNALLLNVLYQQAVSCEAHLQLAQARVPEISESDILLLFDEQHLSTIQTSVPAHSLLVIWRLRDAVIRGRLDKLGPAFAPIAQKRHIAAQTLPWYVQLSRTILQPVFSMIICLLLGAKANRAAVVCCTT